MYQMDRFKEIWEATTFATEKSPGLNCITSVLGEGQRPFGFGDELCLILYCVFVLCILAWFLTHFIGAAVFIRFSSNDKKFSRTACDCRAGDGFIHGGHLSPAVGEGVIHLHITETRLPIISSNCIHLQDTNRYVHLAI